MSYTAIVARITTRPHPNADRLQIGLCLGNQVIVGLTTKDGDLGVYFPTDGQLSDDMCVENKLYNAATAYAYGYTWDSYGFFDEKRRVRAQRFRGEKSDGFWIPVESLAWAGNVKLLKEGDQLTEFGGQQICQKYYNQRTLKALRGQPKTSRKESIFFPKHQDTTQFRFVADTLPDDGVYYITEKLHGTSGRFGRVLESVEPRTWVNWVRRLFRLPPRTSKEWVYRNGSRNVILEITAGSGFYGTNEFRHNAVIAVSLRRGEILFFELVGWVNEHTPIMPPHSTEKLQDKTILERYGKQINYHYSCAAGTCRLYVYKIAHVNEDAVLTELSWPQVQLRCRELGLNTVPLLSGPFTANELKRKWQTEDFHEAIRWEVENHTMGCSTLDDRQIREGVVLRVESPTAGTTHIKNKSWEFGVMEGYLKDLDTSVDLEEIS